MPQALLQCGIGDGVARVFGQITLPAKCIESNQGRIIHAERMHEALNRGLVMARLAGQGAVAVRMQPGISQHPDRRVCAAKSRFRTDLGDLRIGDVARRAVEETTDRLPRRRDFLKTYADQVFEAHRRRRPA